MDFLFYCRDKPNVSALLERHVEAHWSYMDGYAERLLTRGPSLSDDGEVHTGSLHIVRLDDRAEAEAFAYQEPFYRAGVYGEVMIRRWHDRLGRGMRDFKPANDDPLFLVLGHAAATPDLATRLGDRAAVYGGTLTLDGTEQAGFAAILQAPSRDAVAALLGGTQAEIHRWRIGGRH
ncbi:YciI family protein [Dongia sp.]|uniref:YciI family protein n=1 Tax=Dongia sp. TaxID=1977262 RepID=UPI003750A249